MNIKKLLTLFKSNGNKIIKYKSLIGLLILAGIIILYFDDIAIYLYGQASDSKGKSLSVLVTIIGGFAVFYGLYLNSKRIKEQTRQNDLSDKSNNDKRFGEAIGYLNSDNIGVAIGGAYALYQLAKEDNRYTHIAANILNSKLSTTPYNIDKLSSILIEILLKEEFNECLLTFNKVKFESLKDLTLIKKTFIQCEFNDVTICKIELCDFKKCERFEKVHIYDGYFVIIENSVLSNCKFHCSINNNDLYSLYNNSIISCKIGGMGDISKLHLKGNKINGLDIYSKKVTATTLEFKTSDQNIILGINDSDEVTVNNDSIVERISFCEYIDKYKPFSISTNES